MQVNTVSFQEGSGSASPLTPFQVTVQLRAWTQGVEECIADYTMNFKAPEVCIRKRFPGDDD